MKTSKNPKGAGRKVTGRKRVFLYITDEEEKALKRELLKMRKIEEFVSKNIKLTSPKLDGWEYLITDYKNHTDYSPEVLEFKDLDDEEIWAKSMGDGRYYSKDDDRTFCEILYPTSFDEDGEAVEWEMLGIAEDRDCERC